MCVCVCVYVCVCVRVCVHMCMHVYGCEFMCYSFPVNNGYNTVVCSCTGGRHIHVHLLARHMVIQGPTITHQQSMHECTSHTLCSTVRDSIQDTRLSDGIHYVSTLSLVLGVTRALNVGLDGSIGHAHMQYCIRMSTNTRVLLHPWIDSYWMASTTTHTHTYIIA